MGLDSWRDWRIEDVEQSWSTRDTVLYALGVGCGAGAASDLGYVYEAGVRALPTLPLVLGAPGFWPMRPELGLDWLNILHGEQGLVLHRAVPATGRVIGRTRVESVVDRGAGRGALMQASRVLTDPDSGAPLATLHETWVLRGDGGRGGPSAPSPARPATAPMPVRPPDGVLELPTTHQTALIYRLSGDVNPLHVDPAVAAAAGFARPILHGLASFGVAGRALLRLAADDDPSRLRAMKLRFTAPVFPGETLRTEIWHAGETIRFRTTATDRDIVVMDFGEAQVRKEGQGLCPPLLKHGTPLG